MRQRALILLAGVFALGLMGCASSSDATADPALTVSATEEQTSAPTAVEPRQIKLGVAAGRRTGQTPLDALNNTEQIADRRFEILRAYSFWDSEFPDLRHASASEGGRMLHVSINARRSDGTIVPWQAIATADEGDPVHDELVSWVQRLADYPSPLRVTFHHEADIEPEFGSPEDFVAAWRRFVTLLAEAAPDVETVWVMTSFNLDRPAGQQFWPGDDFVDLIGADAFNWFGCRGTPETWRSPQEVLAPLMAFGAAHPDKRLVLAELGSDEDPNDPGRKAEWLAELVQLLATDAYRQLDTVVFFHNDHDADSTCDWWLDSSQESNAAFAALAASSLFGGDVAGAVDPQCPIVATSSSRTQDLALVDGDGDGRFDFEFGDENRFLGIGDQSNDGADHRVLLLFDPMEPLPPQATLEFRLRIGERQSLLTSPVELRLVDQFEASSALFGEPGELLEASLFDSTSLGGHHVVDVTGRVDVSTPSTLRLQLATPPLVGDGQVALYVGMGDANRSIDRPTLIARLCE